MQPKQKIAIHQVCAGTAVRSVMSKATQSMKASSNQQSYYGTYSSTRDRQGTHHRIIALQFFRQILTFNLRLVSLSHGVVELLVLVELSFLFRGRVLVLLVL